MRKARIMEKASARTAARKLMDALVSAALLCMVAALYFIPMAVGVGLDGTLLLDGRNHLVLTYILGSAKAWTVGWWRVFDARQIVLTVSLLSTDVCAAALLLRARRRLRAVLSEASESPHKEECL